jgi:hypothetical protein
MKRFTIIAAAALAAGGFGYVGCDRDETASNRPATSSNETAGDKVDRVMDRAGNAVGDAVDKTAEATRDAGARIANATEGAIEGARQGGKGTAAAPDAEGIRDVLASVTEAALTENGLDDLTERLVDADRNRIGNAVEGDFPDHAALVRQFRADWKAKYGKDFDIDNEEAALPDTMFTVRQGEMGELAAGAEVDVDRTADGSATVDVDPKSGVDSPDSTAADANRNDPGRNVAMVEIKPSHGLPALTVPLIHEAPDAWRIDVPDTLDANKLKQNVVEHLQAVHAMKDQWPATEQEAYAVVTHHVLMALLDKPAQK